jgi:DNA-directed RNA polymerase subunit RPC12/RpoP
MIIFRAKKIALLKYNREFDKSIVLEPIRCPICYSRLAFKVKHKLVYGVKAKYMQIRAHISLDAFLRTNIIGSQTA